MLFSPANQLLHEVKELASEIHGTPAWAHFPRWYSNGASMWTESSSGSHTLTVNFKTGKVLVPSWKDGGRELEMPAHWNDLWLGSQFNRQDGSAVYPDKFDEASAQEGWKRARS
jgi:hypothetical protein